MVAAPESKRAPRGSSRLRISDLPDGPVFAACEHFLRRRKSASEVARELRRDFAMPKLTREQIYPIVAEGIRRDFVVLSPPRERLLEQRLADRYRLELDSIEVLDVRGEGVGELVAGAAADRVCQLVSDVAASKRRAADAKTEVGTGGVADDDRVHLGLGAGWTTMTVARRLASRLGSQVDVPDLTLHALSAGYSSRRPRTAPVAFFNFFHEVPAKVEYVGMFAPAAVLPEELAAVKRGLGVQEAFDMAPAIDIVVSSLASAEDEHGQLRQFLQEAPAEGLRCLQETGWVGDVQCQPYSRTGPILEPARVRAVTLFGIADLVRLASTPGKYVVLVAAPCGLCRRSKSQALRPLLESPSLRLWTHLVLDAETARGLL